MGYNYNFVQHTYIGTRRTLYKNIPSLMFEMNLYMFRPQLYMFIDICGHFMWSQIFDKKSTAPSCGDFLPATAAAVGLWKYKTREF